jgi:hypothetical protein
MKNIVIKTLAGEPIMDGSKEVTLRDIAIEILLITEKEQSGKEKLECFNLANKIFPMVANQEIEIEAEETILLRKRLEKYSQTLVWAQCQEKGVL